MWVPRPRRALADLPDHRRSRRLYAKTRCARQIQIVRGRELARVSEPDFQTSATVPEMTVRLRPGGRSGGRRKSIAILTVRLARTCQASPLCTRIQDHLPGGQFLDRIRAVLFGAHQLQG